MYLRPLKLNMHILIINWCFSKYCSNLILRFKSKIPWFSLGGGGRGRGDHDANQMHLRAKPAWKCLQ